jgi:hypothetical protein
MYSCKLIQFDISLITLTRYHNAFLILLYLIFTIFISNYKTLRFFIYLLLNPFQIISCLAFLGT